MIELSDDKILYAFSKDLELALTVKSGETVRVRTKDCFGNQVQTPEDELDSIDWDAINPATGPIYVEGAMAGGSLKVRIDAIEFDGQTASCTGKDEGVYGDKLECWSTRLCKIEGDELVWDDKVRLPLTPMIGVIGVAPAGDPVNCGTPGAHGGLRLSLHPHGGFDRAGLHPVRRQVHHLHPARVPLGGALKGVYIE